MAIGSDPDATTGSDAVVTPESGPDARTGGDGTPDASAGSPEVVPVDADGVVLITVGTVLWWVAFGVLFLLRGRLEAAGHGDWVWIAFTGGVLGFYGIWYTRRRRAAIRRNAKR